MSWGRRSNKKQVGLTFRWTIHALSQGQQPGGCRAVSFAVNERMHGGSCSMHQAVLEV